MILDVNFQESVTSFDIKFDEVHNISDGGYERGLVEGEQKGYDKGSKDGYAQGHNEGYSQGESVGYGKGHEDGYTKGEADGRSAEWNALWDGIQNGGKRTKYNEYFTGAGWTKGNFKPKYNIAPTTANNMLTDAFKNETEPVDLVELLEEAGVELDLSKSTDNGQIFSGANIKRVGVINASASDNSTRFLFRDAKVLETIEALILREYGSMNTSYMFLSATSLRYINRIEGVFGASFDMGACKSLSKQTLINVINALSPTTSGLSFACKYQAVNKAFETAEGLSDGSTSEEWLALIATKPNWTISISW
jgi:hypothetical protein